MRRLLILISAFLALATLSGNHPTQAQEPSAPESAISAEQPATAPTTTPSADHRPAATTAPSSNQSKAEPAIPEAYKFDENNFVAPSYENLARLYWNLGVLDINDNQMIDNFLAITDCELFMNYQNKDLEWRDIRELARASIRKNYKSWPTSFKVMIPLYLRDYHADKEYFDVDMKLSVVNSARRIETFFYKSSTTCGKTGEINGYPRNLILFLNRPFSLAEVPAEKELARLFLDEISTTKKKENDLAVKGFKDAKGIRMAYLEIFFKVHSFKEVDDTQIGLQAVVFTQIDHIRVYADIDKEKLLYEQSMYEEGKRKRRKRDGGPITDEDLSLPSGPLFGEPLKKK